MKKIILGALAIVLFVCAFAISVSAASQSYASFEVVLPDGTRQTVYTVGIKDLGNGQIYLSDVAYTEAPVDSEGSYAALDWSTVEEIDFTVTALYYYNSKNGTYTQYAGGTNGNANGNVTILKGWSNASAFNTVKKVNTGNAYSFGPSLFKGWTGIETVVLGYPAKTLSDDMFYDSSIKNVIFDDNCQIYRCNNNLFRNCDNLVSIDFPDSFTYLGNSGLLSSCDNLERVGWPSNCPEIPGGAFSSCPKLVFEIPNYITNIKATAFSNCTITSITIPATVTEIGYNAFSGCSKLTTVIFEEGCSISKIGAHVFEKCDLREIKLPNTVTQLKQNVFSGNNNLKVINLGASFTDFNMDGNASSSLNCGNALEKLYLSKNFTAAAVRGNIFSGDVAANEYPKRLTSLVVYYEGDKAAAEAIVAAAMGDGTVVNGVLAYMTVVSLEEYKALEAAGELSGRYMIYGYNKCDAFYKGVHAEGVNLNSCQFGCGRNCGEVAIREDAEHVLVISTEFGANGYFSASTACEKCTVCDTVAREDSFDALFVNKGVSAKTFGEDIALVQGYEINRAAIGAYKNYVADFDFGILAYANNGGTACQPKPGEDKVVDIVFDNMANDYIEVKLTGVPQDCEDVKLVFCAYVTEGESIYYLDDGETLSSVIGKSYNDIVG